MGRTILPEEAERLHKLNVLVLTRYFQAFQALGKAGPSVELIWVNYHCAFKAATKATRKNWILATPTELRKLKAGSSVGTSLGL